MSTTLCLSVADYNRMLERDVLDQRKRKIELIRREIREMNPARSLQPSRPA